MTENIYESELLAAMPDMSMHPGGLRLSDRAARLAGIEAGMTAADIGSGAGATAAFLSERYGLRTVGLEVSQALVNAGQRQHPGLELLLWDGAALPFECNSLDAALLECVLSVLGGDSEILSECARALKPSGTLIVSDVVSRDRPTGFLPTADGLTARIARAGFDIKTVEDHTPALKTYVAALHAQAGGGFDARAFFGASCPAAQLRLSELEYTLIIARKL